MHIMLIIPYLGCLWLQLVAVVSQPQIGHSMLQRTEVCCLPVGKKYEVVMYQL